MNAISFPSLRRAFVFPNSFFKTMIQTRNKMKSHKAASKRFIKTAQGFKRKQAGRNHGNGRFSSHDLQHLDSFVKVGKKGGHLKNLEKSLWNL